ncbi:L,D-transpeptidase family protein [Planotetraspora sp. A-T 1434]|uniref:L,D-transpeptidase family protein n=1 Tax=Planotetraspora sp. A-T 1434 TaxID=2979219 RepID=UPI0021BE3AA0|nr:L,D-transpeptidase family protein [Planotetraspora sp. A-T 1434]MCT9930182.1 L,D-transpeptidase family protein [Planotetraspora sp. A-T 1434]
MGARRQLAAAALVTVGAVTLAVGGVAGAAQARVLPAHASTTAAHTEVAASAASTARSAARFTAPHKTLKLGAKGAAVLALQTRLKALGYVPGKTDGKYGGTTLTAVWAFQKVQGIAPTSTVARRTWAALENPKAPAILVPNGKPDRAEVNLTKQLMVLYLGGVPKLITHISSGSGIPYTEWAVWNGKRQQFTGDARTPTGDFKTTWRKSGWHKSYLGQLYNPIFFNGGIAFHGALSVPLYPASHGCVRLPMHVADILPGLLGTGVPVHVRGKFVR